MRFNKFKIIFILNRFQICRFDDNVCINVIFLFDILNYEIFDKTNFKKFNNILFNVDK